MAVSHSFQCFQHIEVDNRIRKQERDSDSFEKSARLVSAL